MSMTAAASIHPAATSTDDPHYWGKLSAALASRKDLSPSDKMVLVAISIIARGKPGPVHATQRQIADAAGLSVRTVRRSIEALVKKGLIDWDASGHVFTIRVRLRGEERARTVPCRAAKSSPAERPSRPPPSGQVVPSPAPALIGTRAGLRETGEREIKDDDGIGSATQTAEMHACASSSSSSPPGPSPSIPVGTTFNPVPRIPLASAIPAPTPRVPRFDPLAAASGPAVDQALFSALVARAAALLNASPEVARAELEGFYREFGAKARAKGLAFGLFWLSAALDAVDAHNRKPGNLPVRSFRFLAPPLLSFLARNGPPPPRPKPEAAAAPPSRPKPRAEPPPDFEPLPAGFDWRKLVAAELAAAPSAAEGGPRHG